MTEVLHDPVTGEMLEPPAIQPNGPAEPPQRRRRRKMPKRVRAPIPTDETKRQKFVRLVDPQSVQGDRRDPPHRQARRRQLAATTSSARTTSTRSSAALSHEITRLDETMVRGRQAAPAFSIED